MVIVAVLGLLASATAASAHYLSTRWRWSYESRELCTKNYGELSHSPDYPGGRSQSAIERWTYYTVTGDDCGWKYNKYRAILRIVLYRWNGSRWALCADTDWVWHGVAWRSVQWLRSTSPPCGSGYYTIQNGGYIWHDVNTANHDPEYHGMWMNLSDWSSTWYQKLPAS